MIRNRILVPVNFTSQSDAALLMAANLAYTMNARITCLHIIEDPKLIGDKDTPSEIRTRIRREAEDLLSYKVSEIIDNENILPYDIIISMGKVSKKILEKARDLNADMIIMGKSDSVNTEGYSTGINSGRVIRNADIPVLLVSDAITKSSGQILLPLSITTVSHSDLAGVAGIAQVLQAKLQVLCIMDNPLWNSFEPYRQRLDEIEQFFSSEGLAYRIHTISPERPLPDIINEYSSRTDASMLVLLKSRDRNSEMLAGSTVNEIISKAMLPVLNLNLEAKSGQQNLVVSGGF